MPLRPWWGLALSEALERKSGGPGRYSLLQPDVWQLVQERQRAYLSGFLQRGLQPEHCRLLELGCGAGGNLLEFLRAGFQPAHLQGIELQPQRFECARARLPAALALHLGDATAVDIPAQSQDIVFQATVFSSVLDPQAQQALAQAMWRWLRPGGWVLWYDFTYNNPRNPQVRGLPLRRVRELFPHGKLQAQRLTLAPPLARPLCALSPALYPLFNAVPWLRTHVLAWVQKPQEPPV
jgi:SAM-dependent methyltransferase